MYINSKILYPRSDSFLNETIDFKFSFTHSLISKIERNRTRSSAPAHFTQRPQHTRDHVLRFHVVLSFEKSN